MKIPSQFDSIRKAINEAWIKLSKFLGLNSKPENEINPQRKKGQWGNKEFFGYFMLLFFGIWLSPQTSAPEVRQALISRWP